MVLWVIAAAALVALAALAIWRSVTVVGEDERGVVFRLGRAHETSKPPGLYVLVPGVDRMVKVSLNPETADVSAEDQTADGLRAEVEASVRYRITDPVRAVLEVEDYANATLYVSRDRLRERIRQSTYDDLSALDDAPDEPLARKINESTLMWAVEVEKVTVSDINAAAR